MLRISNFYLICNFEIKVLLLKKGENNFPGFTFSSVSGWISFPDVGFLVISAFSVVWLVFCSKLLRSAWPASSSMSGSSISCLELLWAITGHYYKHSIKRQLFKWAISTDWLGPPQPEAPRTSTPGCCETTPARSRPGWWPPLSDPFRSSSRPPRLCCSASGWRLSRWWATQCFSFNEQNTVNKTEITKRHVNL